MITARALAALGLLELVLATLAVVLGSPEPAVLLFASASLSFLLAALVRLVTGSWTGKVGS